MQEEQSEIYNSDVNEYRLQDMKMHESIVKQVYLDGTKYQVKEQPDLIYEQPEQMPAEKPVPKDKNKNKIFKPKNSTVSIETYNKSDGAWWQKIFPCCSVQTVEPDFEDCDECQRRVYKQDSESSSDDEPYISHARMKQREKQSINVFYDKLSNNPLMKTSWQ